MKKTVRYSAAMAAMVTFFVAFLAQPALAVAAAVQSVEAFGADTVAGYETLLTSTQVSPWQDVTFYVTKPDGTVLKLVGNGGLDGVAKFSLADYHTRRAGLYTVQASTGLNTQGAAHSFSVYPDKVSADQSAVFLDRTVVRPGAQDAANLDLQLVDNYGNAVANHLVQVFANRTQDTIKNLNVGGVTDLQGKARFSLGSSQAGVSEYTVLDATAGIMLGHRVKVAYVSGSDLMASVMMPDVGGEFPLYVNVAKAAAGPMNNFDIGGLPPTIQPNQNVNFTITARDAANAVVQNYMGKVHFSADGANGANVTLPEDYSFTAGDLGVHQFSLGLSFKAAGTYKIVVTDLANNLIKGTKDVTVGGAATLQNSDAGITLDTPIAGTYNQKVQTISGKAQSGYTVKIYDNQQEIGSIQATSAGKYAFQTSALSEGKHVVYAVMFDVTQVAQGTSSKVEFNIKTSAPLVDSVVLDPDHGIQPNSPVTIKVMSEANLTQVAVVVDGNITQLNPGLETSGLYVGTIQAPANSGVYPVDVLVVDQLSNEGSYKAKAQLTVSNEGVSPASQQVSQQGSQESQQVQPPASLNTPPSKVRGVFQFARDAKVVLVWDAATDAESFVKHYRVYYGNDPRALDRYTDTFDPSTTWYVPNLQNGREYYFAVSALDSEGLESAALSELVQATPAGTAVAGAVAGTTLHNAAEEYVGPLPTPQTGPELLWILFGSGAVAALRRKSKIRNLNDK